MSGLDLALTGPGARRLAPAPWRRWVALPVVQQAAMEETDQQEVIAQG